MANLIYKQIIEEKKDRIKQNVKIHLLLDDLYSSEVLDWNDYEVIKTKLTPHDQIDYFFGSLSKQHDAERKYRNFVDVIKKHYSWLHDEFIELMNNDKWKEERYRIALHFGDFPKKPAHYVDRTDKIMQVQNILKRINIGEKVVLHGMTGCGKSSLAAGVMDKEIVLELFDGKVFWINAASAESDQIIRLMHRLYFKLHDKKNVNLPGSIEDMRLYLKNRILKEDIQYRRMLLILDNVSTNVIIEAFDIGCKILITTQSKDVVKIEEDIHFIEISGTFKKEESLVLFAKCLDKPIDFVKNIAQANKIHDICKGHPMHIALLGSQMVTYKNELVDLKNMKRWNYFLQILQMEENLNQQFSAISSCIETLDKDLRDKYEDFCIFPEDVNITSKVLETMWNLDDMTVSAIMTQLENKSLIVSYYSTYHNTYIYGIHVVLLRYLKQSCKIHIKERHRKFISAYDGICNLNYANLPNDNYIYQYIGYHLRCAGFVDRFTIYFDLNFIGAKVRATGIGDLLKDFHIYEKEIVGEYMTQSSNKVILNELELFVNRFGEDLHKYQHMNIIQCGLKQPKDGYIYKAAYDISKHENNTLYFNIQPLLENYNCFFALPKYSTFVCFGRYENEILMGTEDGDVELWEHTYRRTICKFRGHKKRIIRLEVEMLRNKFMSLSEDGVVKLWSLDTSVLFENYANGFQLPYLKQLDYRDFFGSDNVIEENITFCPLNNDTLICASFSNDYADSDLIVTGSQNGLVTLWDGQSKKLEYDVRYQVNCIRFSYDDLLIIASSGRQLFLFDTKAPQKLSKLTVDTINSILLVDDDNFVTVHNKFISLWKSDNRKMPGEPISDVKELILYDSDDFNLTCGDVYENEYLFICSNDEKVIVFDLQRRNIVERQINKNGCVQSLDILSKSPSEIFILYGYENNCILVTDMTRHFTSKIEEDKFLPVMNCFWPDNVLNSIKPRIAIVNTNRKIQIMNNFNMLNETEQISSPIKAICFSQCGNKIAYGLENGTIIEYEIKTKQSHHVMSVHSSVTFLNYFDRSSNEPDFQGECNGLLVAAGENGTFIINRCGKTICLSAPSCLSKVSIKPIIQCFYIEGLKSLLTVSDNRTLKTWCVTDRNMEVLRGEKTHSTYVGVTMASMSKTNLLCITMTDGSFEIYKLETDGFLKLINMGGNVLNCPLRSCGFSYDGRYLALGSEDGSITIFEILVERNSFTKYTILNLHKSAVRHLLFSPNSDSILMSVGEQVAWWNLSRLPDNLISKTRRSFVRPKSCQESSLNHITKQLSVMNLKWSKKLGSCEMPYLLRAIKLQGSHANCVSASPNFTSFVIVDDIGKLYIMEMLD